nr:MAG TPA: hypothetical protein [Crassvirales sp.]
MAVCLSTSPKCSSIPTVEQYEHDKELYQHL